MQFVNAEDNPLVSIAAAADICLKPWKHSVVEKGSPPSENFLEADGFELMLNIECRCDEGRRYPEHDLDVEIFKSGNEFNIMISWINRGNMPILWQGKHSLWMDAKTGERCQAPVKGNSLEAFGRKLRLLFFTPNEDKVL